MKQVLRIILIFITFSTSYNLSGQVLGKFGANQSTLDPNAVLEVESTSKGILLPRLTTAQQNAMSSPTNGMLIYNTDLGCFSLRAAGVWRSLCADNGGNPWSTLGNSGTVNGTNFIGTTDNIPLSIRVNNIQSLRFGTDTSFYRGNTGNTRGTNAVDMQSMRGGVTQVASGRYAVLSGGQDNTASGHFGTVGGGYLNNVSNDYSTISGGGNNAASGDYATISGGSTNTVSGSNANIGGGTSNTVSALRSTVGGGFGNTVSTTYSNINGGSTNSITSTGSINTIGGGYGNAITGNTTYSVIGGGNNNALSADRATIAGGQSNTTSGNASFIGGGYHNTVSGSYTTLAGGADNVVSNGYAALVGGNGNTASGNSSFIGGGSANVASGSGTAIVGGSGLTLSGNNSFGFNALSTPSVSATNIAYFGDVNLWLGNVGSAAKELRFYEPNASLTYTGTNYTAFKAGTQAADITYTLPTADGSTNQVLATNGSGTLSWTNSNAFAWSLLGNGSTVDGTNFIGTTDNIPLSIKVNNQKSGRIGIVGETYVGYQSGNAVTSGQNNTLIGYQAGTLSTVAWGNTAVGYKSLYSTVTGQQNVSIGDSALVLTTAGNNVALGYQAGMTNTTGTNNTLIGNTANVASAALTNATAIGNGASVDASNKIRLGNASVTLIETYGSFTTISDRRLKNNITDNAIGLNFIKAVRPVQYELKSQKGIVYDGFIAQEIDSVLQKQGIQNFSGLSKPQNTEGGYYTVSYATFVVPLVNAVKELDTISEKLKVKSEKCEADNVALRAELEKMKKENATLKANVDKNSQDIEAIKASLNKKQN